MTQKETHAHRATEFSTHKPNFRWKKCSYQQTILVNCKCRRKKQYQHFIKYITKKIIREWFNR